MKIFNDIFGSKRSMDGRFPERFSEGEQGDFYVENGVCITCGAPEAEAPDLIEHSKKEWNHCYFKKQPKTNDELDRAINALQVSCISGIRYGGKDEIILKRLYEMGLETECDYQPIGNYKMIVRNKVTFKFTGTVKELSDHLKSQILTAQTYLHKQIIYYSTNEINYFEFTYRWTEGKTGITYKCKFNQNGETEIIMTIEKNAYWVSVRGTSAQLNTILLHHPKVQNILWFDLDGNMYDQTQPMY